MRRNSFFVFSYGVLFLTMSFTALGAGDMDEIRQEILSCADPSPNIEEANATDLATFVSENCAEEWSNCKGDYELLSLDRDGQISSGKLNYCSWYDGKNYITVRKLENEWEMLAGSAIDQIRTTILSYAKYPKLTVSYTTANALARFVFSKYLKEWDSCQGGLPIPALQQVE